MSCARADAMLAAVHCGEAAEADCDECAHALAEERAFVAAIERGLAAVRPMGSIARAVRARLHSRVRRRVRVRRSVAPLVAAAVVAMAVALTVFAMRRPAEEPEVVRDVPRVEKPVVSEPPTGGESSPPQPPTPPPTPVPKSLAPTPPPMPEPEPPTPEPPKPEPSHTEPEPARVEVAVIVRSGALTVGGRKLTALLVGDEFRAQGRTRVDVSGGSLVFDAGARARFDAANAIALVDGEMLVDMPAATAPELRLAAPVRPVASPGRFMAVVRPDRVVIEEGAAMSGDVLLAEGRQYRLGREVTAERRTLPATRPKETIVWHATFDRAKAPPETKVEGYLVQNAVKSKEERGSAFYASQIYVQSNELKLYVAKPTTHVRFRYLMRKRAPFTVQSQNVSKSENFQVTVDEPVVGEWTTVTLRVMDLPVNPGGIRGLKVEAGDRFSWIRWMVGRPGEDAEMTVDDLQVVEIVR